MQFISFPSRFVFWTRSQEIISSFVSRLIAPRTHGPLPGGRKCCFFCFSSLRSFGLCKPGASHYRQRDRHVGVCDVAFLAVWWDFCELQGGGLFGNTWKALHRAASLEESPLYGQDTMTKGKLGGAVPRDKGSPHSTGGFSTGLFGRTDPTWYVVRMFSFTKT